MDPLEQIYLARCKEGERLERLIRWAENQPGLLDRVLMQIQEECDGDVDRQKKRVIQEFLDLLYLPSLLLSAEKASEGRALQKELQDFTFSVDPDAVAGYTEARKRVLLKTLTGAKRTRMEKAVLPITTVDEYNALIDVLDPDTFLEVAQLFYQRSTVVRKGLALLTSPLEEEE